jgi:hypothetical protein
MMRFLLALLLLAPAVADDRWIEFRSGPFQVLTSAGDRSGRDALNQLEQLRYVLGAALGKPEMKATWPMRVVVSKAGPVAPPALARDALVGSLVAGAPAPPAWMRECGRILLEANARRMPAGIESGLLDFFSTMETDGPRLRLGKPPAKPNPDWARMHMLETEPAYSGKIRVMLFNLQQGSDLEPAFRNAFGKGPAEIDRQAAQYFAAGNFQTIEASGAPISPRMDFKPQEPPPFVPQLALADLRGDYRDLLARAPEEAHEGMGLVALRQNRPDDARKEFEAGTKSARGSFEYARLVKDTAKARGLIEKAIELNPDWAEPHAALADLETDPSLKLNQLKIAAQLAPRNAAYLQAVAEMYLKHDKYPEAGRAWAAAEAASTDDAERARIRAARASIEQRRVEFEAAERKRREEQKQRDLQRVKDSALAEVRAAEARANRGQAEPPPDRKIVDWWDGPAPSGVVRGKLIQVECLKGTMRLVVEPATGGAVRLFIRDPGKVIVMGTGDLTLACGPQRSPRSVVVEYFPKADAKAGTAGDVATVEYMTSGKAVQSEAGPGEERQSLPRRP